MCWEIMWTISYFYFVSSITYKFLLYNFASYNENIIYIHVYKYFSRVEWLQIFNF